MNKKYLPSALILYLNYFIHGVGCSILGQAVIKEALAASWGVEAMAITAISAALGLGRLIALPFAGPLSDKLGRRISTAIGSGSYAIYLIGLALAFNAGTNGGYGNQILHCNRPDDVTICTRRNRSNNSSRSYIL